MLEPIRFVLIECGWDSRCVALCSFTRVNVFLLLDYLARPHSVSYEHMRYADGSNIIRMDEAEGEGGKHTQVMRMHTGREGRRPWEGNRIRTDVRLFPQRAWKALRQGGARPHSE